LVAADILWQIADYALNVFHTSLILFVMFAWVFKKLRRAHAVLVFLVLSSWIGLGYFFGWGYCLLTDWHWQIKRHLGETELPESLISYLLQRVMGLTFDRIVIDIVSVGLMFGITVATIVLNLRDSLKKSLVDEDERRSRC